MPSISKRILIGLGLASLLGGIFWKLLAAAPPSTTASTSSTKTMASYLITGASRGLGLELTRQLSARSDVSTVFATARGDSPKLQELASASSGKIVVVKLDVTDEASIKQAAVEVEAHLGGKGLDVLINNAGVLQYAPKGVSSM